MVELTCPWCDEESAIGSAELAAPSASFTCPECDTTVTFTEEPVELDLAA